MIRWSLSKASLVAETPTGAVYKVEQNGRAPAALKIVGAGSEDARRSTELLLWYAGEGAVTVFDHSTEAVFMEWMDGKPLSDPARHGRDAEATEAFGHVVAQLQRVRPDAPTGLVPLRAHYAALLDRSPRAWPLTSRDMLARSIGLARWLFDKPAAVAPLHGNLHHDTILSSDRGWLAVDPKGLLGDPCYELADAFRNPSGAEALVADPARVAAMADSFVRRLGFNRRRMLAHAAAHCALSACWELEAGRSIVSQLAVLPHILAVYDQSA